RTIGQLLFSPAPGASVNQRSWGRAVRLPPGVSFSCDQGQPSSLNHRHIGLMFCADVVSARQSANFFAGWFTPSQRAASGCKSDDYANTIAVELGRPWRDPAKA